MAQHGRAVWCLSQLNVRCTVLCCVVLRFAGCSSMGHAPGAAAADISLQTAWHAGFTP